MDSRYSQVKNGNTSVHFSKAMFGEVESSRMVASPTHLTTFNAGDLVPIYCREVLPDESISLNMDFVIRQTTILTPTMGQMHVDIFAFFVPNRIVNKSWKAVEGENFSGSWTANPVSLAPLKNVQSSLSTQVPVGSVADYYGFPTQLPIPNSVLNQCHDLKFRGYVMIWNEWFRDQNYQPPIPISYLNVYQGFFDHGIGSNLRLGLTGVGVAGTGDSSTVSSGTVPDGSFGAGAIVHAIDGSSATINASTIGTSVLADRFDALGAPLKVNKLHDYFTSVLPSPQKASSSVFAPVSGLAQFNVPVVTGPSVVSGSQTALRVRQVDGSDVPVGLFNLNVTGGSITDGNIVGRTSSDSSAPGSNPGIYPANLSAIGTDVPITGLGMSVDDIRMASAIQQVYETLARGGSLYRSVLSSFFGIDVDDPFDDIPKCLGHLSRDLDLYQTAQTSPSESGSTPQGNLAAFGYTSTGGKLFEHRFIEHGYLHIFAVVRHRNIYPSFMSRDNFRLNMLDFYSPPLANISEQPVYTREINPFASNPHSAFGYQEAWAEYRYEPDQVFGYMRPGIDDSLRLWNYSDNFDSGLQIADGNWLKSNSQEVLDETLAVRSTVAPQFKAQFKFFVDKTLPMPTYSVPGLDII